MTDIFSLDSFVLRALMAGIGVALIAGPLGCFVVWRRMAYFGDSLAHSALLGIALGFLYGFNSTIGVALVCSVFAAVLMWLQQKRILATDTLLGILAHAALSVGMVAISFLENPSFDLHSYLFGDILTVTTQELAWIFAGVAVVLLLMVKCWSSLVLMTLHEDIARAEGVRTMWHHILFICLMTLVVAVSLRIAGILLITSMLIIPAATARQLSRSPEMMAVIASMLGIFSVVIGITASTEYDLPSGPSIVSSAAILFVILFPLSLLFSAFRQRAT